MNLHSVGKKLEMTRRRLGLTQRQLADLAGVSYRPIIQIEAGRSIRLDTLLRLCDALGIELVLADRGKIAYA